MLSNFDKLSEIQVAPAYLQDGSTRQERNVETIRRLLRREAYFLDEERKWIATSRNDQNSTSFSATVNQAHRAPRSPQKSVRYDKDSSLVNHEAVSTIPLLEEELDSQRKEVSVLHQNLLMEKDLQTSLNQQLEQEISFALNE